MALNKYFPLKKGQLGQLKEYIDNRQDTMVFYCQEKNRLHLTSQLNRKFLYVVGDIVSAKSALDTLNEYCDGEVVLIAEREDVLILRQVVNYNSVTERLTALNKILDGKAVGAVITVEALLQLYPESERYKSLRQTINVGDEIALDKLCEKLVAMGYTRAERVENVATFCLRGDILDIYTTDNEEPYRIEFFGDTVESIKLFSHETILSISALDSCRINPVSDILVYQNEVDGILSKIKKCKKDADLRLSDFINTETERFVGRPSSMLNTYFLPFMKGIMGSIYGYFPSDTVVVYDDVKAIEDKLTLLQNAHKVRVNSLLEGHKFLSKHIESILSREEITDVGFVKLGFGRITSNVTMFAPKQVMSIKSTQFPRYQTNFLEMVDNLSSYALNKTYVRIFAPELRSAEALQKSLLDNGLDIKINDEYESISIVIDNISYGFGYPTEKSVCIGYRDYSRHQYQQKSNAVKRQAFTLPERGDYVVHEKHGIGISEGMQKVMTTSGLKEFYVVLYKDGDRLYLPADQLDTLDKYNGGETPNLHRLGGAEFERVKERVKASIKAMAIDLLSLYQARADKKGHKYQSDTVWQDEMEKDFEFTPTDDQLIAISEIKQDMEKGKIMDRLLCGDVGFGKTEVALRGVFKTVIEGKQAVILAPTTILAQQHYNLVRARFNKYKFGIDLLSRFVTPKETVEALKRIQTGETNVIVATHRILSKDVKFHDLGLLVLDEEQRFGVEQKEQLKVYKNKINILSLSATPIPRTLHMALNGIRDISTLETPPKNRLPIETYVTEYSDELLVNAVNKELSRGGQVFLLYNRVKTIEAFYKKVRGLFDDGVNIVFAHGQMDEEQLEDRVKEFYENRAQIMISTTIIENGIDLPNANTLFVIDADMLGLNQLYQLRGRVGRSNTLAYAYFTIREGKVLTETAMKRLSALMDNTELGSGFKIAMRDLEIRGAGNVLGREQHGQMEKVGYELYLRLVKEGIDELKGVKQGGKKDIELKVDGDNYLDEGYISDSKARVSFYKRISSLSSVNEGREYHEQLTKMYGKTPESVINLIRLGVIKNMCQAIGAEKVAIGESGVGITFYDNGCFASEGIIGAVSEFGRYAILVPSEQPTIVFEGKKLNQKQRIKMVLEFLCKVFEGQKNN